MPERRTVRSIGVAAQGRPEIFSYEEEPPAEGSFRTDTLFTGLSAGTELTFLKGTNPYLHASWDAARGVFLPGTPSRSYPIQAMGYMEAARVVESRTPVAREGDLVAVTYGHRTGHVLDGATSLVTVLPEALDPLLGIYVAQMGPICVNGLLHAAADAVGVAGNVELADGVRDRRVLVTGGGVVGLLTGLLARMHGAAEVALADPDPQRLAAAERLGLLPVADDGPEAVWRWCVERWQHGPADVGADVVFQCRGQDAVLATALRSVRPQGTVVDLAFYQGGAPEVRLGEEFHHKGLTIRCAQIGRVPRGLAGSWNRARLSAETLELLAEHGDAIRQHVVTDVVPFDDGPSALVELAGRRRSTIQTVFAV
ncbi:MAG TPA: zinc-binding alcohol dehydrogenase [Mycobacteriales bacterium]|nr:zinc-binding alcohol dehydrogenase [Mycobacteriales bacterium]